MAVIRLNSPEQTQALGRKIAQNLPSSCVPAIFLYGPLGAGKTFLTTAIVSALPGADDCEIGSPSFNIYNVYPTKPVTFHCDLYRCKGHILEEICDALIDPAVFMIMEWSEYLDNSWKPADYLDIYFKMRNNNRLLEVAAKGAKAQTLLNSII